MMVKAAVTELRVEGRPLLLAVFVSQTLMVKDEVALLLLGVPEIPPVA